MVLFTAPPLLTAIPVRANQRVLDILKKSLYRSKKITVDLAIFCSI